MVRHSIIEMASGLNNFKDTHEVEVQPAICKRIFEVIRLNSSIDEIENVIVNSRNKLALKAKAKIDLSLSRQ